MLELQNISYQVNDDSDDKEILKISILRLMNTLL